MNSSSQLPSLPEIIEEFEFLNDRDAQIDYLIDLGMELPKLDAQYKSEHNRVHGCQSNVWLIISKEQESDSLSIQAESDALIVNGLIAILLALYEDKTASEVLSIDVLEELKPLHLETHISPQRKNGLNGMIQRIRELASLANEHQE